jgi:hypothetical protein
LLGAQHQHQFAQTEAAVYVPAEAAQACTELGVESAMRAQARSFTRLKRWLPLVLGLAVAIGATLYLTAAGHA